jgi:DNA-binding SARP family transcriptional activator
MAHLAIYLLGPPRIEHDGVPIQVDTRKAVALLAYLAITGESHRRASLINLLWPEFDRTQGRAALRRTLYALRKALSYDWVVADREEIGLMSGPGLWVDVDEFHRLLAECETHRHPISQVCPSCVARLTDAVALYHGDLLSGFSLKDSINFDDWQFFQADALRSELADVLKRLVSWHSGQRDFPLAIGYAKRWLALDPFDEQASCQLMQLYAWSGQRPAALRQYEQHAKVLQDQLRVAPSEAITELYEAIERGCTPPLPTESPAQSVEMPAQRVDIRVQPPAFLEQEDRAPRPVFVAREAELAQLEGFLDSALTGQARAVFVTGDAGCGKTALIQEFARRAQADNPDLVVAWGHGNAHTGIGDPYLPFREALALLTGDVEEHWAAGAMSGEQARRLWQLLPHAVQALVEVGPDLIDLFVPGTPLVGRAMACAQEPGAGWLAQLDEALARKRERSGSPDLQQSALFEQYSQVLRALTTEVPLLLALDDLQWIDRGSASLLFHLGRRIAGSRILIVGAYRPAEIALGRPAASLPITAASGQVGEELDLDQARHPLAPIVNEFRRRFGSIEVDLHRAEGWHFVNAFLDSEPNRLGEAFRDTLYRHTAGYPLFTVELLRGMQQRGDLVQDEGGRWIAGTALDWQTLPARVEAVIGERIGRLPERLQHVLAVAAVEGETFTAEVIASVDAADPSETVRCLSDTLDRKHRLVSAQRVLRIDGQCLSRYRFRHILFQKHLYNSLDAVQRVHLHQAVGTALESLYGGSSEQAGANSPELARHFQEAGIADKAIEYLLQAGQRARRLYANAEAVETFRRALVLLESVPPDRARVRWRQETAARIQENLGDVLEWTGEHDEARMAYQNALARAPVSERIWQSHLYRKIGNVWRLQSGYESALQAYDRAQAALGDGSTESTAEWWQEWVQIRLERMWVHYWLGQWRDMSELAKVRPFVEQYGTPAQGVSFYLALASMIYRRDRYRVSEETLELCRSALALSQEAENLGDVAWAGFVLGFNQLWHGDLEEAEQHIQAALTIAEQTGDVVHQSRCLTYLTVLYRKRAQSERVRQYAAESLKAAVAGGMTEYTGMAHANLAWLAWREEDLARTETEGQAALELWGQLPAGHSSCAFQWAALWPLAAAAFSRNRDDEAIGFLGALLEPTQQCLPGELAAVVQDAVKAWKAGEAGASRTFLGRALELAEELGYL